MENLIQTTTGEVSITLKEITDLIGARHDKAMAKIEILAQEPSFGSVSKIDIQYLSGKNTSLTIQTYVFNKKQAIAVAARLDNSMLMKVIDRLEELESQNKPKLMTPTEMILLQAQEFIRLEADMKVQQGRLDNLESNFRIENWQQKRLEDVKNFKVYELAKKHDFENDPSMIKTMHSRVWNRLKKKFAIPRYNELPICEFDNGISFIQKLTFAELI